MGLGLDQVFDCSANGRGGWRFLMGGTWIRVEPWFWLAAALACGSRDPAAIVIWVAVCFLSILVHEFGHVMAYRAYRARSEVVLYAGGGLTLPHREIHGARARVFVALAGPLAGFVLAAVAAAGAVAMGGHLVWNVVLKVELGSATDWVDVYRRVALNALFWVNINWGIVNLLPVVPLDGGHAARAVLEQADYFEGRKQALQLSLITAAVVAGVALLTRSVYLFALFAMLAAWNVQCLQRIRAVYRATRIAVGKGR